MKNVLLLVLTTVLPGLIVAIGLAMVVIFFQQKFTFTFFMIGLIGYFIALRPAVNVWEENFKRWFKIKE